MAATPLDAAASVSGGLDHAKPMPLTYTVGAGADRCVVLLVHGSFLNTGALSATYGGQAMTLAGASSTTPSSRATQIFYLLEAGIAAAGASHDFSVTWVDADPIPRIILGARSFINVTSVAGFTSAAGATGTTDSRTPAGATANDYSIGGIVSDDDVTTTAGSQLYLVSDGLRGAGVERAGATSTLTWTFVSLAEWGTAALLLVGTAGGGSDLSVRLEEPIIGGSIF